MAKNPALTLAQLRRAVEADQLAPVYLLLGPDAALRRRAAEHLVRAIEAVAEGSPGAITRLDASEMGLSAILDEARSLPLFAMAAGKGPTRLVWVRDFGRLVKPRRGGGQPLDPEPLTEYLESPVGESCLVLEATELDKRTALYKALARYTVVVDCTAPTRDADLRRWIDGLVRTGGCSIDHDAAVWLVEMIGSNIAVLEQELAKATLFVGEGGVITTQVLAGLAGRTREHTVFELTDALVQGSSANAIRVLNRLLDDGEQPLRLLPMIAWITRQMVIARDLVEAGCPQRQAMEALAGRWNQRRAILERGRRARRGDLTGALAACGDTDLFVKRLRDSRQGADRLRPARGRLEALCRQICAA